MSCLHVPLVPAEVSRRQAEPLELELWILVNDRVLGTEPGSSIRAASALLSHLSSPVSCFLDDSSVIYWMTKLEYIITAFGI